jgi:hypothetical protein
LVQTKLISFPVEISTVNRELPLASLFYAQERFIPKSAPNSSKLKRRLMKRRTRVVMHLAALCFVLAAYGFATDDAYLYIVHGIPGRGIAATLNPGFPIDVLVNGESCLERGLAFGSITGPLGFSAGTYDVQISEANSLAPCTNPSIISSKVALTSGASVTAVAAMSGGEPTLLQFTDNLSPVAPGYARFVFVQSADAGALQVTLTQLGVKDPKTFTITASPGKQQGISVPDGTYLVQVAASGSTTLLASEQIEMADQTVNFTYAAGEASNSSVGLINKTVRDVF